MVTTHLIETDDASDLPVIREVLEEIGKVMVRDEKRNVWRVVQAWTPYDRHLAEMNCRVYAMSEQERERWYAQHPLLPR
jgi:hypothetical protein